MGDAGLSEWNWDVRQGALDWGAHFDTPDLPLDTPDLPGLLLPTGLNSPPPPVPVLDTRTRDWLDDRKIEAKKIRCIVATHHEFAGAKRTAEEAASYVDEDESGGITGTVTLGGFFLMALAFVGLAPGQAQLPPEFKASWSTSVFMDFGCQQGLPCFYAALLGIFRCSLGMDIESNHIFGAAHSLCKVKQLLACPTLFTVGNLLHVDRSGFGPVTHGYLFVPFERLTSVVAYVCALTVNFRYLIIANPHLRSACMESYREAGLLGEAANDFDELNKSNMSGGGTTVQCTGFQFHKARKEQVVAAFTTAEEHATEKTDMDANHGSQLANMVDHPKEAEQLLRDFYLEKMKPMVRNEEKSKQKQQRNQITRLGIETKPVEEMYRDDEESEEDDEDMYCVRRDDEGGGEGDTVYWKQAARAGLVEKAESQQLALNQMRIGHKKTKDAWKGTSFNALFPATAKKGRHSL